MVGTLAASAVYALGGAPLVSANGVSINPSHAQQVVIPDHGQWITVSDIFVNSTTELVGVYSDGRLAGTIQAPIDKCNGRGYGYMPAGTVCPFSGIISARIGGMIYVYQDTKSIPWVGMDEAVSNATAIITADSSVMRTLGGSFNVTTAIPLSFNSETGKIGSTIILHVISPNGHFLIRVDLNQRQVLSVS